MNGRILFIFILLNLFNNSTLAQIQGVVTDASTSEPLIGATLININSGEGAVTGIEGDFSIKANIGDRLEVSYTGFQRQGVVISTLTEISIQLEQGVMLDELVVTGYSIDTRRKMPGSVSTIKARDLQIGSSSLLVVKSSWNRV